LCFLAIVELEQRFGSLHRAFDRQRLQPERVGVLASVASLAASAGSPASLPRQPGPASSAKLHPTHAMPPATPVPRVDWRLSHRRRNAVT
jgi:hypothetical protein